LKVKNMYRVSRFFLLGLLLLLAAIFVQNASAQEPVTDDEVNAIAKNIYCPVCENVPLDVCPTKACADWREEIRNMLAEGKTEAEIRQYFVDRFGDRVLGAPPARGLNWLAYIIPPIAILGGIILLYSAFRMWKKPEAAIEIASEGTVSPSANEQPKDEYIQALEAQLEEQDR